VNHTEQINVLYAQNGVCLLYEEVKNMVTRYFINQTHICVL